MKRFTLSSSSLLRDPSSNSFQNKSYFYDILHDTQYLFPLLVIGLHQHAQDTQSRTIHIIEEVNFAVFLCDVRKVMRHSCNVFRLETCSIHEKVIS